MTFPRVETEHEQIAGTIQLVRIGKLGRGYPTDDLGADGPFARLLDMYRHSPERRSVVRYVTPLLRFVVHGPKITQIKSHGIGRQGYLPEIALEIEQHVFVHAVEIDPPQTGELLESDQRSLVFVGGSQRPRLAQVLDLAPEKGVHIAVVVPLAVGRGYVMYGKRPPFAFQFGDDASELLPLIFQKQIDLPDESQMRLATACYDGLSPRGVELLGQQPIGVKITPRRRSRISWMTSV